MQFLLLVTVAVRNVDQLNADGVAYLRIAGYWAAGATDLAVNGYWGPLLSWLMAPLLAAGVSGAVAARSVMVFSAVVFAFSCYRLLTRAHQRPWVILAGLGLACLSSVSWSVEALTPDLLLAGWLSLALAHGLKGEDQHALRDAAISGCFFGLAYVTKAVALPFGIGIAVLSLILAVYRQTWRTRLAFQRAGLQLALLLAIAAPWITVLSLKYHRFTFSTTAAIAHTLAGPEPNARYHPSMRTLHHPSPGRVTSWEDPSEMNYARWSPLASRENLKHQGGVIAQNIKRIWGLWASYDVLGIGPLLVIFTLVLGFPKGAPGELRPLGEVLLACVCLGALYLPVVVGEYDWRYLYPVVIPTFAGGLACISWGGNKVNSRRLGVLVTCLWGLLFAVVPVAKLSAALSGEYSYAGTWARMLAADLKEKGLAGPVAGSGLVAGVRTGLLLAYELNQPWYGDRPDASAEQLAQSGAKLVVMARRTDPTPLPVGLKDLDGLLFAQNPGEAQRCPVRVLLRENPGL